MMACGDPGTIMTLASGYGTLTEHATFVYSLFFYLRVLSPSALSPRRWLTDCFSDDHARLQAYALVSPHRAVSDFGFRIPEVLSGTDGHVPRLEDTYDSMCAPSTIAVARCRALAVQRLRGNARKVSRYSLQRISSLVRYGDRETALWIIEILPC